LYGLQQHKIANNDKDGALLLFHSSAVTIYIVDNIGSSATQRELIVTFPRQQLLRKRGTTLQYITDTD
jgi:hypothetical protein